MTIEAGQTGKCPYCGVATRFEAVSLWLSSFARRLSASETSVFAEPEDRDVKVQFARCANPECKMVVIFFDEKMIQPMGSQRTQAPKEVPEAIRNDYTEACLVEGLSKKAAAALARRCLQNMFHDQGIKKANLEKEIEEAINQLPSHLADDVDAIRHVGNFAAHPLKSSNTGEIVDVEPQEAEYLLDTLVDLFDHYYVKPAKSAEKRAALQAKLTAAGKNVTLKTK